MSLAISALTFDASDAITAASFWAAALGGTVAPDSTSDFSSVERPAAPTFYFQHVDERKTAKNRIHLDLTASDLDGEVNRLTKLGAIVFASYDSGPRWVTLHDPDGNEFCVVAS